MSPGDRDLVLTKLSDYVRREFLGEGAGASPSMELTASSPLLEWGVLTSLNTARLLAYLREEFDVEVPPMQITARHFRDLNSVTELVLSLPPS